METSSWQLKKIEVCICGDAEALNYATLPASLCHSALNAKPKFVGWLILLENMKE